MGKKVMKMLCFIFVFLVHIVFTSRLVANTTLSFGISHGLDYSRLNDLFHFGVFANLFFQLVLFEILYNVYLLARASQKTIGWKRVLSASKLLFYAIVVYLIFRNSLYSISGMENVTLGVILISFAFLFACERVASCSEKLLETFCIERNAFIIAFLDDNKDKSFRDAVKCWKHKKMHGKNRVYEKGDGILIFRQFDIMKTKHGQFARNTLNIEKSVKED